MMARARNLKPGFFKNEDLAKCDPLARLLFAGLWCWADREGKLEDRPERLKAEILPYDKVDVSKLLDQLAARGFILRYEASGKRCIQITTFAKHANPYKDEPSFDLPDPLPQVATPGNNLEDVSPLPSSFSSLPSSSIPSSSNAAGAPPLCDQEEPDPSKKRRQRKKDELFDAVVEVTASDPTVNGPHIGRVCKALRNADPPYTPADVRRFAELVETEMPWHKGRPSVSTVEKYIGIVRAPPNTKRDATVEALKAFVAKGETREAS